MKKLSILLIIVMLSLVSLLSGCSQAEEVEPVEEVEEVEEEVVEPLRIVGLLPGRIDDMSFNQQLYEGLMIIKDTLGEQVDVTYVEGLYEVVDIEPALRDYAEQGYDLIIGHGFQFQDPIMAVAELYPAVNFAIGPGAYMTAENVSTYDAFNPEVGYVLGTVAGYATEAKVIGTIGGVQVPNINAVHESFRMGSQAVDPDIQVINIYTGDFSDAEAAREAGLSMVEQGADLIFASGNGMVVGALGAARDTDTLFITTSNMSASAPEIFLASLNFNYQVALQQIVDDVIAGTFGNSSYALTFGNKGLELVIYLPEVVADSQEEIDSVIQGLIDGSIEIPEIE